jgi:hypothetical protein
MAEWLAAVEADTRDVPLAQKVVDAKKTAGVAQRCVAANGADAPLPLCRSTVDATLFSSPRIEAGGGDPVVGFTDDRLDCELTPLETSTYAGRSFAQVFTPAQQELMKQAFPTGVCDYTKPGKGFQAATTWLTYQDDDGAVVYGGTPLGDAPRSVPFGPGTQPCAGAPVAPVTDRSAARSQHQASVDCVLFLKIARGTSTTTYGPTLPVTRGQMAAFLVNALDAAGLPAPAPRAGAFRDVAGTTHHGRSSGSRRPASRGATVARTRRRPR